MNNMRVVLIVMILIIITVIAIFYIAAPREGDDVHYNVVEISSKGGYKLYIMKKVWGLTSDGQVIVISDSPDKKLNIDSSRQYIYNGVNSFFYKYQNDTLTLYISKIASVPVNLKTSIIVKQVELENPDMMRLIENDHYKKQGLETIN